MARDPAALLSVNDTINVLRKVDALLDSVGHHLAKIAVGGPLSLEQVERLRFAMAATANLQRLFAQERARLDGPTPPKAA